MILHAIAHQQTRVFLNLTATAFVVTVVVIGPVAGVAASVRWREAGAWIVTTTMAAALAFGVANHFIIAGPDHVNHVTGASRPLFAITAWLLGLTEAAGVVAAVRVVATSLPLKGRVQ
jgi:hypothetical protein